MATKSLNKKSAEESAIISPEYLATLKWLTPSQAAAYLQMSRSSLAVMQREKTIPFSRVGRRIVRFDRLVLDAWVAENAVSQ